MGTLWVSGMAPNRAALALTRHKAGIRKLAREGQIIVRPQDLLTETDLDHAVIERLISKSQTQPVVECSLPQCANFHAQAL